MLRAREALDGSQEAGRTFKDMAIRTSSITHIYYGISMGVYMFETGGGGMIRGSLPVRLGGPGDSPHGRHATHEAKTLLRKKI